ncbi:RpiB/LacA/LacB family sugar-phosphate isomerase [Luteitalea sp.]|jgi:ribose 5-phosphate isomerase B|uniref:RpiB/LacA/LacB family sugar-phosphate isomerase n=1 Tax=Luteitalea sp. TaxID=2004800 RepID=UPI0037C93D20
MARFAMITEADARMLPEGSTVELLPRGHVTPLAADTLRDRRITVIRADQAVEGDGADLVPVAQVRRLIVGSDHTGVALKAFLVSALRGRGLAVQAVGPEGAAPAPADYPDIAEQVGLAVVRKEADAGIVIDGAGLGSTMAANKVAGVRAALCLNETLARYAREHNGANVLALGASLLTPTDALAIVMVFLGTPMTEPRYIRRLTKLQRLDKARST